MKAVSIVGLLVIDLFAVMCWETLCEANGVDPFIRFPVDMALGVISVFVLRGILEHPSQRGDGNGT